ncbi:hypothetical protein PAECIP111893_04815 [Paenibacillus plantiphilus]|uniref:Uncharacterized protein n=1 Tax=Paenibacillus plantiphilus TaxID=2905650 RepID=A0ABM9CR91_9BACL|nr:hypothetical protein [Paenibacillus plantiphilus]CAH1222108.1 hypothetical protein PAECIP111893_04815 [Paenibacillus plantiphilus]
MGVKHAREYEEILADLTEAIHAIGDGYLFFDMEAQDWESLSEPERKELMQTLADDVFFGLGEDDVIEVGSGVIAYRSKHHCIEVSVDGKESRIVRLI